MRMDIEISPRAPAQRWDASARSDWGPAAGKLAGRDGRMIGKRFCSNSHPATVHRECARRFLAERTMGILWRHFELQPRGSAARRTGRGMNTPAERRRSAVG